MKKENLITPSDSEKEKAFDEIMKEIFDTDISNFEQVFQAGIDLMIKLNKKNIIKTYNELGFDFDLKEVLRRLNDDEEEGYDELYEVNIIDITDVTFNAYNSAPREMTIKFTAKENRGPLYTDLSIKINSHGIVNVDIFDTPWEGGGVETEMTEIIMKYCAQQKYLS